MKITKSQLRRIIKEEISESVVGEVQKLVDGNQYLKGSTVTEADLIDSGPYVFYVSDDGLKHTKDRHQDENAPGSLFDAGADLRALIKGLLDTPPTTTGGGKIKWEGVDSPTGNIGKMGLAVASPEEVAKMKSYKMPGGRGEEVKVAAGNRKATAKVTLASAVLGKLTDGRDVLSLLTIFPGGMEIDGVTIPDNRNDFAGAGIYFVLPPGSPILGEGKSRITRRQLRRIVREAYHKVLSEADVKVVSGYSDYYERDGMTELGFEVTVDGAKQSVNFEMGGSNVDPEDVAERLASELDLDDEDEALIADLTDQIGRAL